VSNFRASRNEERAIVASLTETSWHRSDAMNAAAPVVVVRWARSSCPSVLGGLIPATSLDEQFTR
jgi:hypothetical protein